MFVLFGLCFVLLGVCTCFVFVVCFGVVWCWELVCCVFVVRYCVIFFLYLLLTYLFFWGGEEREGFCYGWFYVCVVSVCVGCGVFAMFLELFVCCVFGVALFLLLLLFVL